MILIKEDMYFENYNIKNAVGVIKMNNSEVFGTY